MSSLQTFDFLLAAMVLCLEMNHLKSINDLSNEVSNMYSLLESTYDIWANHPNRYRDSIRGAEILRAMLKKCSTDELSNTVLQDPVPNGLEKSM